MVEVKVCALETNVFNAVSTNAIFSESESLMLFFLFYSVSGFVDKNRDSQQDVFFDLLGKSKSPFVQQLVEYRDLLSQLSKFGQLGSDAG